MVTKRLQIWPKMGLWPKKVGNWPFFKKYLATKMAEKWAKNGSKWPKNGLFWAKIGVFEVFFEKLAKNPLFSSISM